MKNTLQMAKYSKECNTDYQHRLSQGSKRKKQKQKKTNQ